MLSRNLHKKSRLHAQQVYLETRKRFKDNRAAATLTESDSKDSVTRKHTNQLISQPSHTDYCSTLPKSVYAFPFVEDATSLSTPLSHVVDSTTLDLHQKYLSNKMNHLDFKTSSFASVCDSDNELDCNIGTSKQFLFIMQQARQYTTPKRQMEVFRNYQGPNRKVNITSRAFSTSSQSSTTTEEQTKKQQVSPSTNSPTKSASSVLHRTKSVEKEKSITVRAQEMVKSAISSLVSMLLKTPGILWFYITHPKEFRNKLSELKDHAKKEIHHYYMGSKLLMADLRTARSMLRRTLQGSSLTRRERKQLLRTVTDVFRIVPMSVFVLIPFMEFALPFALKIFPNMLPSTFQDSLKAEENMKRELKSRIAMAEFFQETLHDLAKEQKKAAERQRDAIKESDDPTLDLESTENREETASSFLEFINKARKGEMFPPEVIIRYSTYFKDDLTLDNMPRMQLINMCRYMSIPPYGNDQLLRFQLRHKIRVLQEDDQRILWEGIDSLTKMELREACQERGMRSTGLSKDAYKSALQQWINLSVNRNVPISLLIMSRTFFLHEEIKSRSLSDKDGSKSVAGLADAISGLDKEVVNEVILDAVEEKSDPALMQLKLEVLEQQNELINEEKLEREAEEAKRLEKELSSKEKVSKAESEKVDEVKSSIASESEVAESSTMIEVDTEKISSSTSSKEATEAAVTVVTTDDVKVANDLTSDTVSDDTNEDETEEEATLSSEEIDAISQLVSPDPVSAEREKLERLKAAMQKEQEVTSEDTETNEINMKPDGVDSEPRHIERPQEEDSIPFSSEDVTLNDAETQASETIADLESKAKDEADSSTTFSVDDENIPVEKEDIEEEKAHSDGKLDKTVSRLQAKVESMVGKLEIQLSDIEGKIGDKMHILDKDMDGILSREEMALCLQSVLKRPLSMEEAMAIAADMDQDEDGYFSVEELKKLIVEKLVEEGRDAEVDSIIASQGEKSKLNEREES